MFLLVCVRRVGGIHVTTTHGSLNFTVSPPPPDLGPRCTGTPTGADI